MNKSKCIPSSQLSNDQHKHRLNLEIENANEAESKLVSKYLWEYNKQAIACSKHPQEVIRNYVVKDGIKVIAGINACIYWGVLYIDILFVAQEYRGVDLGSRLVAAVENDAINMGVKLSHLYTFDFQAKDFYAGHGYEVFGVLEDCPPGHTCYYMKKNFNMVVSDKLSDSE